MQSVFKARGIICLGCWAPANLLYYAKRAILVLDVFIQLMPVDTQDRVIIKLELLLSNSFSYSMLNPSSL